MNRRAASRVVTSLTTFALLSALVACTGPSTGPAPRRDGRADAGADAPTKAKRVPAAQGWVYVEARTFLCGSPPNEYGRLPIETQHEVTLTTDFLIQPTEVTQEQFQKVMGYNPSHFLECGPTCPVEDVTWHEAAAYCNRLSAAEGLGLCYSCTGEGARVRCQRNGAWTSHTTCPGYRLPTEAEWEFAARAGESGTTYNGEITAELLECNSPHPVLDPIAWFCGNSGGTTHPVAQKEPNAFGLYDVLGNVWEWSHDWDMPYRDRPLTDPWGPVTGLSRVGRGGSWVNKGRLVRFAARGGGAPDKNYGFLGFRPVRSCLDETTAPLCRHEYRSRWAADGAADAAPDAATSEKAPPPSKAGQEARRPATSSERPPSPRDETARRNGLILVAVVVAVLALFGLERLVRRRR